MDVTKDNFMELLPHIQECINNAEFITIDVEMTGLSSSDFKPSFLDTVEERYKRTAITLGGFLIVEFGLCTFQWDDSLKRHVAKAFNFVIYPHPYQHLDKRFMCQASSLLFLASHNFDFNKFVYKGIPFLSRHHEDIVRSRTKNKLGVRPTRNNDEIPLREADKSYLSSLWSLVDTWHSQSAEQCLFLPGASAYQRRLIFQELPKKYNYIIPETIEEHGLRRMRLSRADPVQCKARFEAELNQSIGFRFVLDAIIKSNKLIVGHNMLYDLLMVRKSILPTSTIVKHICTSLSLSLLPLTIEQIYQQFEAPLPDTSVEFKQSVHKLFPKVIDTKYLATVHPTLQTTNLIEMYQAIINSGGDLGVDLDRPATLTENKPNGKWHEAGFDSYATGVVYLYFRKQVPTIDDLANRIPLLRSDSIYCLDGPDSMYIIDLFDTNSCKVLTDHCNTFYVTDFQALSRQALEAPLKVHFSKWGAVRVTWLDDVSCFVTIGCETASHTEGLEGNVVRLGVSDIEQICSNKGPYKVMPFASYHEGQLTTMQAMPFVKRK